MVITVLAEFGISDCCEFLKFALEIQDEKDGWLPQRFSKHPTLPSKSRLKRMVYRRSSRPRHVALCFNIEGGTIRGLVKCVLEKLAECSR